MRKWTPLAVIAITVQLFSDCRPKRDNDEPPQRLGVPTGSGGCYEVASSEERAKSNLVRARSFRLDTARVSLQHPELRRVITPPGESSATSLSLWSADSLSDTLRISIGDGFTGVTLATVLKGATLAGEVTAWGDGGPWNENLGRVRLTKIPCVP